MNKEVLRLSDVAIGYGKNVILKDISFSIFENDFIGLVGPNGAGKTTLLKTILGTLRPISGSLRKEPLKFGYVPQRDVVQPLLPYSVNDVVLMGRYPLLGMFKRPSEKDREIADKCIASAGISGLKDANYNSLSGGQRQRTLIARALAVQPDILILDEPTNGMDTPSHYALLDLISSLHEIQKLTIILVSHLLSDVANIVKKLILIDRNYFQAGNIDEVLSEENLRKTYSSNFMVTKINDEYIITSKHREK